MQSTIRIYNIDSVHYRSILVFESTSFRPFWCYTGAASAATSNHNIDSFHFGISINDLY